jgi:hypothetical protein
VPGTRPCHPGWGDRAQDCHTHRVCCARPLRSGSHRLEVRQGSGEVVDDLPGDHLGCGEVVEVLRRGVLEPGGVEVGLVPRDELVVAEGAEPLTLHALLPALGPERLDELVHVAASQRILLGTRSSTSAGTASGRNRRTSRRAPITWCSPYRTAGSSAQPAGSAARCDAEVGSPISGTGPATPPRRDCSAEGQGGRLIRAGRRRHRRPSQRRRRRGPWSPASGAGTSARRSPRRRARDSPHR